MNSPLFRLEAINAQRDRLAGTVIAATPPRSGVYISALLLIMAAGALLLVFGHYSPRAQAKGFLSYDAGIARIHPNAPGEIRTIHVREGQVVRAGEPLVTIALAQGRGGMSQQLDDLNAQDRQLAEQQRLTDTLATAEIASLERQRDNLRDAIASLERQRGLATSQAGLADSESRRARALAREGAGSQRQVEEARAAALARRADAESLSERMIQQRDALRAAEAQITQRRLESERSRADLAAQRAALAAQQNAVSRQDSVELTAPVDGRVEQISMLPGERATSETPIMTLVPTGGRMEAWLYVPTRGAGFVQPGQDVNLLFDAFPNQVYGAGHGTVVEVSRAPVDGRTLQPQLGLEEPVFRIRVAIDRLPEAAHEGERLRAGMTLTANVELERRSLWEILFNPFAAALR